MQKMVPKLSKTQVGTSQKPSKSTPGTPLDAKMHRRCAIGQPRDAQESPRRAPRAPKRRPRGFKRRPRTSKSPARAAQEGPWPLQNQARRVPRPVFGMIFVGSTVQKAPEPILYGFLACAQSSRYAKNLDFCRSCQCFVRVGAHAQCCFVCIPKP